MHNCYHFNHIQVGISGPKCIRISKELSFLLYAELFHHPKMNSIY